MTAYHQILYQNELQYSTVEDAAGLLERENGLKRTFEDDDEPVVKKTRKRGRPSYWNNLVQNVSTCDDKQKTVLTPQILIKRQRRLKANDRERNRMKNLNKMLQILKSLLPFDFNSGESASSTDDKLTKIETLRMATQYIYELTNMLNLSDQASCSGTSSPVLSSPNEIKEEKFDDISDYYIAQQQHMAPPQAPSINNQYYSYQNINFFQTHYPYVNTFNQ